MKKIIITSILIVGLAAGFAFAHDSGQGMNGGQMMGGNYGMMGGGQPMMGPGMMGGNYGMGGGQPMMGPGMMGGNYGMMGGGYGNCPGAAASGDSRWTSELQQKFLDDTVELRKELNDTYFTYQEARRNPATTREQLVSIEKELIDLRSQLQERAEQRQ